MTMASSEVTEPTTPSPKTSTGLHITLETGQISPKGPHEVEHREHYVPPPAVATHGHHAETELFREAELAWCRVRRYLQDPFSEFCGTFILILFGDGVVAQVVLSGGTKGDYQSISWGWG